MSYQLTERPHKFSFSKNPIRYLVEISNPEATGCALDVELYVLAINADYDIAAPGELVTRQTLYPNPDGKTYFYCEDFLNSWLEWELPSTGDNNIKALTKQIKKFYIRYRQITKSNPTPPWASESDDLRIVIKGGVAKEKFDRNNFFVNYLPAKKPFLTWQPDKHFIGPEERRYLTYFHSDNVYPPLVLKARVVYTDGSQDTATKDLPDLGESLLFHLPAGLDQLGLYGLQPLKQIWYYDVSVEDDGGSTVFASPYRLYADYRKYYDVFSFIYHNSISGIDTLRIRGDFEEDMNLEKTEIQQATGGDFGEVLPTENAVINISRNETYKGDAGWMNTKAFQDSCKDLLLSDNVYRVVFNRWLRVVNLQKTQPMGASDDTKWSFPLQWRYTFDNTQYTPPDKDFGAGINDEAPGAVYGTCTAPGNLLSEFVAEVGGVVTRHFSWDQVLGAEGYELQYLPAGETDWVTVPTTDPEVDIDFDTEADYSWRVRTKCGTDDYSGYSNGDGFVVDLTAFACTAPASLTVALINLTDVIATVKFSWPAVPGVVGYVLEFRPIGDTVWGNVLVDALEFTCPLFRDVQYECRIKSKCDNADNYSGYVYGNNFIPSNMIGTCNAPTGLGVVVTSNPIFTVVGLKNVAFSWTAAPGTTSYQLQLKYTDSATWIIKDVTGTTLNEVALKDKTIEWKVRSNCTGGGFSNFVSGDNFNT
ncbi:MAG: hypothetical protein ABI675_19500 [Chitinophagaceae bacterium]